MLPCRPSRPEELGIARVSARPADPAGGPGRRRRPWLAPLIWAALVIGASSLSELRTTTGGLELRDKLAHFGEYFVFGWLVARCFDGQGWSAGRHFAWTLLFGIYLGVLDEFYQGFVPGRERDVLDLLADAVGTAAGWYFSREVESVDQSDRAPGNA